MNQEDWLDRELREAAPYIDDDGFTVRVLQQLPAPRRSHDLLRSVILLLRPEIPDKTHFEVQAVDIAIKIEQMNFEHALGFTSAHSWAVAEIYHARIDASF